MANEQNLIPGNKRSQSEARENGRKGGKKSGEVRRKRKAMKEQMEMLLALPCNVKDSYGNDMAEILSQMFGIDKDDIDNQMLLIASLWKTATNSNSSQQIQAIREIREITKDAETINNEHKVQIINDLPRDDDHES